MGCFDIINFAIYTKITMIYVDSFKIKTVKWSNQLLLPKFYIAARAHQRGKL